MENAPDCFPEMRIKLGERQSRNMYRTNLWKIDIAAAVHAHIGLKVQLSPCPKTQFIPWPADIIGGNRSHIQRGKGRGHAAEEVHPENRQNLARRRRRE